MRTITTKITCIFFLLAISLPLLFVLSFIIQEKSIRHRMLERLEESFDMETIVVKDKDIRWVKKGKEIYVNHRMFDVHSYRSANGKTTFKGLYDEDETILKKEFGKGWEKQSEHNVNIIGLLFQQTLCYYEHTDAPEDYSPLIEHFYHYLYLYPSPYSTIITPPPQV